MLGTGPEARRMSNAQVFMPQARGSENGMTDSGHMKQSTVANISGRSEGRVS